MDEETKKLRLALARALWVTDQRQLGEKPTPDNWREARQSYMKKASGLMATFGRRGIAVSLTDDAAKVG